MDDYRRSCRQQLLLPGPVRVEDIPQLCTLGPTQVTTITVHHSITNLVRSAHTARVQLSVYRIGASWRSGLGKDMFRRFLASAGKSVSHYGQYTLLRPSFDHKHSRPYVTR